MKDNYDEAIVDFMQALAIDAKYTAGYTNSAVAYFYQGEYNKAWEQVSKTRALGAAVDPVFLGDLRRLSGRDR